MPEPAAGTLAQRPAGAARRILAPRLAHLLALGAIAAFVLLITLPFSRQALHIDDFLFWDFARNNLEHPLAQSLSNFHLMGVTVPSFRDTHPPGDELYLSLILLVAGTGASEQTMHLGYILFPFIAGFSMFFLARRFTRSALLATLLMLAAPVVMVLSHTLMGDLPMTALWLAATALYIYGADRSDGRLLAAAGVAATAAVFTGYQALALIPLLPLYSLLTGRLSVKTALPVALPVFCFALFTVYNFAAYGSPPRLSHAGGLSYEENHLISRIEGMFTGIGGSTVFPLALAAFFAVRRKRWLLLPPVAGAAAVLAYFHPSSIPFPAATSALFIVFATAAGMMLLAVLTEGGAQLLRLAGRKAFDADFLFLSAWILGMMISAAALLPQATARYYLPLLAPVILLMIKEAEAAIRSRFLLRTVLALTIVFTFAAGTAASAADFQLAQAYKDYVAGFGASYQTPGTVWFVGEWGFRHYMEAQGFKYLDSNDSSPASGDLVVKAGLMDWPLDPSVTGRMQLVGSTQVDWKLPVRVMNFSGNAGFYGSFWGLLPYTFTDQPVETFWVYRLK